MNDMQHTLRAPVPLDQCSVAHALALIGDHWTLLILREAFYGVSRFEAIQADLAIPRSVLSQRLRALVEHDIMQRTAYRTDGQRTRFAYELTEKGRALLPVLIALMEWGDQHAPVKETPALSIAHAGCGAHVSTQLVCTNGHRITNVQELIGKVDIAK